jgi:hypothetical protein
LKICVPKIVWFMAGSVHIFPDFLNKLIYLWKNKWETRD